MSYKITTSMRNAKQLLTWIKERKGIAVWRSINLSNPGAETFTPVMNPSGTPAMKPGWQFANEPAMIITDAADVCITLDKEVKRFHIAVRPCRNGLSLKLTDASTRKVETAVEKAGKGAYYEFDYEAQEAVIMAPEKEMSLADYNG